MAEALRKASKCEFCGVATLNFSGLCATCEREHFRMGQALERYTVRELPKRERPCTRCRELEARIVAEQERHAAALTAARREAAHLQERRSVARRHVLPLGPKAHAKARRLRQLAREAADMDWIDVLERLGTGRPEERDPWEYIGELEPAEVAELLEGLEG